MKPAILKRVWREIKEINDDFFNLRTLVSPDTVGDDATRFYYMMLPNDGAMAHLTLVGSFYIPETYPTSPPIVQLFTRTQRFNVDVYWQDPRAETPRTTMCFDILRSAEYGGTWKPEYTLSSLFASLMSAIVSYYVAQQYGGERPESVSMGKLRQIKQDAEAVYQEYKRFLPEVPKIPREKAVIVPAQSLFAPQTIQAGYPGILKSEPIYLQTDSDEVYSFAIDLSGLHAKVVFSVVLSNSDDLVGSQPGTVLVRNGVTATAARKCLNGRTVWFYHGKPMNDGAMRLHVTVGKDQMTFAYREADGDDLYVHGDCPVSWLTEDCIGDVEGVPFYIHIYTMDKRSNSQRAQQPVTIDLLDIDGKGYIFESRDEQERKDFGFELIHHSEAGSDQEFEAVAEDSGVSDELAKMTI